MANADKQVDLLPRGCFVRKGPSIGRTFLIGKINAVKQLEGRTEYPCYSCNYNGKSDEGCGVRVVEYRGEKRFID